MEIKQLLKSEILNEFIAQDYLDYSNLLNIKDTFGANTPKSIKLEQFFKKEKYDLLKKEIYDLKFKEIYIPDSYSFSKSNLGNEFSRLFNSKDFISFISFIVGRNIKNIKAESLLFDHKDYTLLKDNANETFLEINFFFNDDWKEEYGGYFSYFKDEELLRIFPVENNVTIIYLREMQRFVKYINVKSSKRKIYLISLSEK